MHEGVGGFYTGKFKKRAKGLRAQRLTPPHTHTLFVHEHTCCLHTDPPPPHTHVKQTE